MEIRTAAPQDLPAVTRLEALCFPPAEASPRRPSGNTLAACPQTCWLLWEGGHPAGHGQRHDRPDPGPHRRHV